MATMRFDDDTLRAFVEGETDAETSAAIAAAIDADPALAEKVGALLDARLAATREEARTALAPLFDAPVPDELRGAVELMVAESGATAAETPAEVLPFRKRQETPPPAAANRNGGMRWAVPIAASLTLIAGAVGYLAATVGGGNLAEPEGRVALIAAPGLERALSTVASGEESLLEDGAGQFRAIASFTDGGERLCREFELASAGSGTFTGVACRPADGEWQVTFALSTPDAGGGYAPASSLDVLDAYLGGIEAGQPMSAEEEAALLDVTP